MTSVARVREGTGGTPGPHGTRKGPDLLACMERLMAHMQAVPPIDGGAVVKGDDFYLGGLADAGTAAELVRVARTHGFAVEHGRGPTGVPCLRLERR